MLQTACSSVLPSVHTGTAALSMPATTIRSDRSGCAQTSWEPRCQDHLPPGLNPRDSHFRHFFDIARPYAWERISVYAPHPPVAPDESEWSVAIAQVAKRPVGVTKREVSSPPGP